MTDSFFACCGRVGDHASPGPLEDLRAFHAELHGYFERRADALPDLLHLACSVLCVGFLSRAKGF